MVRPLYFDKGKNYKRNKVSLNEFTQKAIVGIRKKKNQTYNRSSCKMVEELNQLFQDIKKFTCSRVGHMSKDFPCKKSKQNSPQVENCQSSSRRCKGSHPTMLSMGKGLRLTFVNLFDPRYTHNFLFLELAQKLGI